MGAPNSPIKPAMAAVKAVCAEEQLRDALDILPLSIVPLQIAGLRRAHLIKNIRLESVVELYADAGAGSGQVPCDLLHVHFNLADGLAHPDQRLLLTLGGLSSYDVFSLRIALRHLGIPINDFEALQLSSGKKAELTGYMKQFTAPLIRQVFGKNGDEIGDFEQLVAMFKQPDQDAVLRNLRLMAEKLRIELPEVPQFLEDYADIFLSLAYFQETLDKLIPRITDFLGQLRALRKSYEFGRDPRFIRQASLLEASFSNIIASITGRFENFSLATKDMWTDINAESFERIRRLITAHHTTVGGVLCGLLVKIRGWETAFAGLSASQYQRRRVDFIQSEMRSGIERIEALEASARAVAG